MNEAVPDGEGRHHLDDRDGRNPADGCHLPGCIVCQDKAWSAVFVLLSLVSGY